jgi:hypothetical protein
MSRTLGVDEQLTLTARWRSTATGQLLEIWIAWGQSDPADIVYEH